MDIFQGFLRLLPRLFFAGGADNLPPTLSKAEEAECIAGLRRGEISAKQTLIERNLRLVAYVAKRFDNANVGLDDLISIGTIGLIKAINSFDTEKNIKLATYASRCIENEILMFLRKLSSRKGEISLDEPLSADSDGSELLLGDVLGTEDDEITRSLEEEADRIMLHKAVNRLPEREQQIITLRFGLDGQSEQTQKEVADRLGISQSYISRLEKRIINRLRKELLQESRI